MTKQELQQEANEYFKSICRDYNEEYERTGKRHYFVGFDIKNAYLASAEPREKQIQIDAEQIRALQKQNGELTDKVRGLEAQFEKLINFASSKIVCCDVCPITDTCINSEVVCPYAGILAMGEEGVTREWLMQFISKEIKENG